MMLSRRELIGKAAVGAAATLAVSAAGVASARVLQRATNGPADDRGGRSHAATDGPADSRDRQNAAPPTADAVATASPPPWELLRPLVAGSAVGHGWRLVDLSPVRHGSCVVTLDNARGRARRGPLCRNGGTPGGISCP